MTRAESIIPYEYKIYRKIIYSVLIIVLIIRILSLLGQFSELGNVYPQGYFPLLFYRISSICILLGVFWLLKKDQLDWSAYLIIVITSLAMVAHALWVYEPSIISFLSVFATAMLTLMIAGLIIRSLKIVIYISVMILCFLLYIGYNFYLKIEMINLISYKYVIIISFFIFISVSSLSIINLKIRNTTIDYLKRLAYIDIETGLPNMHKLILDLKAAIARAHEMEYSIVLIGVHIRGIDNINQRYSFHVGNLILKEFASKISFSCDDFCQAYRLLGGDYALLLDGAFQPELVDFLKMRIEAINESALSAGGHRIRLNTLLAGTVAPRDGANPDRLISNLYNAINRAKTTAVKGQITWFDPEHFKAMERYFQIEQMIPIALETKQFHIVVQPKYYIKEKKIKGGEILARWNHPNIGIVPPAEFITVLESSGYMTTFTKEIVTMGLEMKEILKEHINNNITIAVNISATSLRDELMVETLERFARNYAPILLELEITEDVFISFNADTIQTLQRLKKSGMTIALDDFGTGFSNLQYLQQIEADVLKIDRSFICQLPENSNSIEIVRAMINMAHTFNMEVVAEGAETREQIQLLTEMECDIIQGYGISPPIPLTEFHSFVKKFSFL